MKHPPFLTPRTHSGFSAAVAAGAVGALLGITSYNSSACPQTPAPGATGAARDADASPAAGAADGLEPTPLDFELLGMRFRPPAGAVMRGDGAGTNAVWTISERVEAPRYILKVSRLVASDAVSSPRAQMDALIRSVSERPSPDLVFRVLEEREFEIDGRPAGALDTLLREGTDDEEVSAVQSYHLIQVQPNEFIVVSSLVPEADWPAVKPLLRRALATVELENPEKIARARTARMQRGEVFLATLAPEVLRRALDPAPAKGEPEGRWYRITRMGADGQPAEAGYMTVVATEAAQGAANPDRSEREWTAEERELGLGVRIRVRMLQDERGSRVADSDARYWMAWDRSREFWTVRSTLRDLGPEGNTLRTGKSTSQLGIRTAPSAGMPARVLQVATVDLDAPAAPPRKWTLPKGYLSQPEAILLARLLPRDAAGDFGFYWFDPRTGRLAQRADEVRPVAGGLVLSSRATLESPILEQRCDAEGREVRRSADDGTTIEAIEPKALLELWRRKGLPTP